MDDSFRQLLDQSRRLLERMGVQPVDIEEQMFDAERAIKRPDPTFIGIPQQNLISDYLIRPTLGSTRCRALWLDEAEPTQPSALA
jgi:hypothetical protein